MNDTKKITKRECYNALLSIVESQNMTFENEDLTNEVLKDFINHEIELLDNKAAAAAKRAQTKRNEGDALRARILDVMSTEEFMTIPEIVKAIDDEEVSNQMVVARLGQCAKAGLVEKNEMSVEVGSKTKKMSGYRKLA